jgi:hypothetical protein
MSTALQSGRSHIPAIYSGATNKEMRESSDQSAAASIVNALAGIICADDHGPFSMTDITKTSAPRRNAAKLDCRDCASDVLNS